MGLKKWTNQAGKSLRLDFAGDDASRVPAEVEILRVELEEVGQHLGEAELLVVEKPVEGRLKTGNVAKVSASNPVVAGDVVLGSWKLQTIWITPSERLNLAVRLNDIKNQEFWLKIHLFIS